MLCNIIFTILVVLHVIAIYFFFVKIFPSFWKVCKSYVEYIKIAKKVDFASFLLVFVATVTFLIAYLIYIIGAALWMMKSII